MGSRCRAVYTEDGLEYTARIVSIDESQQTCRLMYEGYQNEEEHNLSDLRSVRGGKRVSQSEVRITGLS